LSQEKKPASLAGERSVRELATDFEWDEAKRLSNIAKHGLDFADSDLFFGSPHLVGPAKTVDGETRWLAVGMIDDVYVTTVFTGRGSTVRIISMRRARDGERKKHQEVFGG
jgi:uncharacterized DUF497 family protein